MFKVKITVLDDNDPLAEYRYLVAVTTGHRHGSATTSHVSIPTSMFIHGSSSVVVPQTDLTFR